MAGALTQQWDQHAFPDEFTSRDEAWVAESERRAQETRLENYLDASGSDLRIRRFSTGKDSRQDKIDTRRRGIDDLARLAIGSPAYMEAYNNQLTFQIGGEDVEITQGQLHDLAKRRAEDLQEQIDAAKRRGANADDIARLKSEWMATTRIADNTDPQDGVMNDDRLAAVRDDLQHAPGLADAMKREGSSPHSARDIRSTDSDGATLAELRMSQDRRSVASTIEASPIAALDVAPRRDFAAAATNAPVPEEQAPAAPSQVPGFNLG